MKRIIILSAAILAFNTMPALADGYKPLDYPNLPVASDVIWKKTVLGCFEQANKRRALGSDVAPVFMDINGNKIDIPAPNTAFRCHVAGSEELAKKH